MVFSSPAFLCYFLPVTLILYFAVPVIKGSPRGKNIVLLIMSLVFYAWGEPRYVFVMIVQCIAAWGFGLLIEKQRSKKAAKVTAIISVALNLSCLIFFKYTDFFISNIILITDADIPVLGIIMPIGISFYTFQIISYTADVYRKKTDAQRNIIDFSTYVASFPQLIAGPIVRYTDIAAELRNRVHNIAGFSEGAGRFIIGLGKKMLLANNFGILVEAYKANQSQSTLFTWLYTAAFTLQIYFDFSGYSDMAIGLGRIFGFKFPENFNYPYIAGSVTEFWKRWHMTLSGWFRDYVYIPLGGSRSKAAGNIFNLMFVWLLTGFWHGADWNFIAWGGYFGIILLIERYFISKTSKIIPAALRHTGTILVVMISWVLFDADGFGEAFSRIGYLFGIGTDELAGDAALYYLRSYAVVLAAGIAAAMPLGKTIAEKLSGKSVLITILEPAVLALILILSVAAMIDGTFNPFIYFRF